MNYNEHLREADINISTSGDNTIIAAPTTGYIAIDHINLLPASAVTIQLKDGTTAYGGAYQLTANQGFTLENAFLNPDGVITLTNATAFVINLNGNVQVSGFVRYRVIGEN